MTDHITIPRALLEQALANMVRAELLYGQPNQAIQEAIRAELAKPVEAITTDMAVKRLCQALRDDLDYAWSWHCNVAMSAYDAGCPRDVANEGAARFMQLLAGVDTRDHFAFAGTQTKATSPTPAWRDAPEVAALREERNELLKDAERYRWLAAHTRSTSEHWGGRWSIVIDGPVPKRHDCEDAFDEAIDAAIAKAEGRKE